VEQHRGYHQTSFIVLCVGLVMATFLVGRPSTFSAASRAALAALMLVVIAAAAWKSGLELAARAADIEKAALIGAGLLILPIALFSLMPGYGPPEYADHARNAFRYAILGLDATCIGTGMVLVLDALRPPGKRWWTALAFALISAATPLYLVWAAVLLQFHRTALATGPAAAVPLDQLLLGVSDALLFFAGLLTYAATAAAAGALWRGGWLDTRTTGWVAGMSLALLATLVGRGVDFPDPAVVFTQGFKIPGWIAGIPAVPWMLPCVIGMMIIRRIARQSARRPTPAVGEDGIGGLQPEL